MIKACQKSLILTIALACCTATVAFAQQRVERLISGKAKAVFRSPNQLSSQDIIGLRSATSGQGLLLITLQPSQGMNARLANAGLRIEHRFARDIFMVSGSIDASTLKALSVDGVAALTPELKLEERLIARQYPSWAQPASGTLRLLVQTQTIPAAQLNALFAARGMQAKQPWPSVPNMWELTIAEPQLEQLAMLPEVIYVQPAKAEDAILNEGSRATANASSATAPVSGGGRGLTGSGVVIGVGDDTDPTLHPDLLDRIYNHTPGIVRNHGAHTTGTAAGAGIINQLRRGFASKARVVSQWFSGIWANAAAYVQDYGMVVTNNSYGSVARDCNYNGTYDLSSQALDQQAFTFPSLLHVFASGNDGELSCPPYPFHYGTVLNGYQSAKNVITVGRTDISFGTSSSSSSGPTKDGRLKPEIVALGEFIQSATGQFSMGNAYWGSWGTSMASPAVAGALALLYERYKQLHAGANPPGALVKNVLLNGANDLGPAGPDYRNGYGFLNVDQSLEILEQNRFMQGAVGQGQEYTANIVVPAGTHQLKVMLYWHDQPASPLPNKSLVNDLDITVTPPVGNAVQPLVLQHLPETAVINAAQPGEDHKNNSEQVVITNPAAGTYTIKVRGYDVAVNAPQAFTVTYDLLPAGIRILSPAAGEAHAFNSELLHVSWLYNGADNSSFNIDASYDGGVTWQVVASNLPSTQRYITWSPAQVFTTNCRIRISNASGAVSTTNNFSLMPLPQMVSVPVVNQCPGYFALKWREIVGCDGYEVLLKQGPEYQIVHTANNESDTSFVIKGLSADSTYYATVRPLKNFVAGRYANATERRPDNGSCADEISDNDLMVVALSSPSVGRAFTSSAFSASTPVRVRIRNLDNATASAYSIFYNFNNQGYVQVNGSNLASLSSSDILLGNFNMLSPGSYPLEVVVKNSTNDTNVKNDTLRTTLRQLPNAAVGALLPLIEGFEALPTLTVQQKDTGIGGTSRWDFNSLDVYGRLRTALTSLNARSGSKAVTLDVSKATPYLTNPANQFNGTYNLADLAAGSELRLDFYFKHHGPAQEADGRNKVWARGNDQQPWLELYDLSSNQYGVAGVYKHSGSLELSDLLAANGQSFSTSTQIRFGQYAQFGAADNEQFAGYSFDDIRLAVAQNDIQLLAISAPAEHSCGTGNRQVTVTLRNSMGNAVSNIPVSFGVNGGSPKTELVSIAANTTINYTFTQTADLTQPGAYTIRAEVSAAGDNVSENNMLDKVIHVQPVVTSYPYFENFEQGSGNWYSEGLKNSWAFGTPNSVLIRKAASGTKAWKTNLQGAYNNNEESRLYSPCFDISALAQPTLRFSVAYDLEDCTAFSTICDKAYVEYSYDGTQWTRLGAQGAGINWYDNNIEPVWTKSNQAWWHVAGVALPKEAGSISLRFVLESDDGVTREGLAIDDIHIYDAQRPIYVGPGNSNPINQEITATGEIHFVQDGKVVTSVLPNGNALGNTEAMAWLRTGALRFQNKQYFANRNITIKPSQLGAPSTGVLFYFTDAEVNEMRAATGCANCVKPADYTELNVLQYTDANKANEDGSLDNNLTGNYTWHPSVSLQFVPYDAGYYARLNVNSFSEFWLTTANPDLALPANWVRFDANKTGASQAQLVWEVSNEKNTVRYEVEVFAPGSAGFVSVGSVSARNTGEAVYNFSHAQAGMNGVYLYRIRQIDSENRISYSAVRILQFGIEAITVSAYPNPMQESSSIKVMLPQDEQITYKLYSVDGKAALQGVWNARAGYNLFTLNAGKLKAGVYLLVVESASGKSSVRLVKQ